MKAIAFALLLPLAGCASWSSPKFQHRPETGPVKPFAARELDVIVALLNAQYGASIRNHHPLMIDEIPSISMIVSGDTLAKREAELLRENSDNLPRSAIRDFLKVNSPELRIGPELGARLPVILLSSADSRTIFRGDLDAGWKRFYKLFPDSPGSITISRVGFSRDGATALVYLGAQQASLAGSGQIYVLKRVAGTWVVEPSTIGGQWIS